MENIEKSEFNQFDNRIIRRDLLPIWIKIFCWLFMLIGVASIGCLIYGALGNEAELSIFGLETTKPISITGIIIVVIMAFKGYTAYSRWFEKDNAIKLAKIDAFVGIVACIISMFILPFIIEDSSFTIRLELLLLIPYYLKINKIEYSWDNLEEQ